MTAEQDDLDFQRAEPGDSREILLLLQRISTHLAEKGIDQMAAPPGHASWPGLSRPSTSSPRGKQDVDARDKPAHDGGA